MKLIYLVFPLAIVSVFFGLITIYSLLPADSSAELPADVPAGAGDEFDVTDKRCARAVEKLMSSYTWFSNLDSLESRLDWSRCAGIEQDEIETDDSPKLPALNAEKQSASPDHPIAPHTDIG